MVFTDQLNRKISLLKIPERIVSLVPSQTELLVDLGLEKEIVGITKFCVHPKKLRKEKTVVGGTKQVHFDKIKDLQPDLILCNKEENTHGMVKQLEKIAPVWVSDISSVDDCLDMIMAFGRVFKKEPQAKEIISKIDAELTSFRSFIKNKGKVKIAYLIWKDPFMVAGGNTFINSLLTLNNFKNVFSGETGRYPETTLKSLEKADLILLSSEPYPFGKKHIEALQAQLKTKKIQLVDGEYFSWYGSRLVKAFDYFKSLHTN